MVPKVTVAIPPERVERLIRAVLHSIENWEDRLREIEAHSPPGTKVETLSLLRDVEMARLSFTRLIGD